MGSALYTAIDKQINLNQKSVQQIESHKFWNHTGHESVNELFHTYDCAPAIDI